MMMTTTTSEIGAAGTLVSSGRSSSTSMVSVTVGATVCRRRRSTRRSDGRKRPGISGMRSHVGTLLLLLVGIILCPNSPHCTAVAVALSEEDQTNCETLKTQLRYRQDEAPKDLSAVLRLTIEYINRELSGVVNVEVTWTAKDLHRRVGTHMVRTMVTRQVDGGGGAGEEEQHQKQQCFVIPIVIDDTDECTLPVDNPMRHACHPSAKCVNTRGGYECLCPLLDGEKEKSIEGGLVSLVGGEDGGQGDIARWTAVVDQYPRNEWEVSLPSFLTNVGRNRGGEGSSSSTTRRTTVPSCPSTKTCCPTDMPSDAHSEEGKECRSNFVCPVDPCGGGGGSTSSATTKRRVHFLHDCVSKAKCHRTKSPLHVPNYICQCPEGYLGNGRQCLGGSADSVGDDGSRRIIRVKPDGSTLDDKHKSYCGCTLPTVDVCAGVTCPGNNQICQPDPSNPTQQHVCQCRTGFVPYQGDCVDTTPPTLQLLCDDGHDGISTYVQGQTYQECGVQITDENAEEYYRRLQITYDAPLGRCFETVGTWHVQYTVRTPWTEPSYASTTRTVQVDDVDECAVKVGSDEYRHYDQVCPSIIPHCDVEGGAVCRNTRGSYTCKCPPHTTGDGFIPITQYDTKYDDSKGTYSFAPVGYRGGTGCRDTTKPVVVVKGPNPKVFTVAKVEGLHGVLGNGKGGGDDDDGVAAAAKAQRLLHDDYERQILAMIRDTDGAELCASEEEEGGGGGTSSSDKDISPSDCITAYDETYKGRVDLSHRVIVGSVTYVKPNTWKVPYDVTDDAGNVADTVWREIVVLEVSWDDVRNKMVSLHQELREEKNKSNSQQQQRATTGGRRGANQNRQRQQQQQQVDAKADCPKCPPCEAKTCKAPGTTERGDAANCNCEEYCRDKYYGSDGGSKSSKSSYGGSDDDDFGGGPIMDLFLGAMSALEQNVLDTSAIIALVAGIGIVIVVLRTMWAIFVQPRAIARYDAEQERRAAQMAESVRYHRSPPPATTNGSGGPGSGAGGGGGGMFRTDEILATPAGAGRASALRNRQTPSSGTTSMNGGSSATRTSANRPPRSTRMFSPDGGGRSGLANGGGTAGPSPQVVHNDNTYRTGLSPITPSTGRYSGSSPATLY